MDGVDKDKGISGPCVNLNNLSNKMNQVCSFRSVRIRKLNSYVLHAIA